MKTTKQTYVYKTPYSTYTVILSWGHYEEPHNLALELLGAHSYEPIAKASVNLDVELGQKQMMIKDYSENEGMLNWLIKQKIVSKPIKYHNSGYVRIPVTNVLVDTPQPEDRL